MTHGHRQLQYFNQWLSQHFLGARLLEAERQLLTDLLHKHHGKHALLIGLPGEYSLLSSTAFPCRTILSSLANMEQKYKHNYIEGDFHELPLHTGSVDLVLLPHILEYVDNQRQVLLEACRIIKPEGLIVICGFNPISMWGLKNVFRKTKLSWAGAFVSPNQIKKWLHLADFVLEKQENILFTPPTENKTLYDKLQFFEYIGRKCMPIFGGVYILLARAKVIPLTPIRMQWKQQLDGIRISSISGHIARSIT